MAAPVDFSPQVQSGEPNALDGHGRIKSPFEKVSYAKTVYSDGEGAGGDYIEAGDTDAEAVPDKILSANAADSVECEDNSTYWDGVAGTTDIWCLGNPTLSVKPVACP